LRTFLSQKSVDFYCGGSRESPRVEQAKSQFFPKDRFLTGDLAVLENLRVTELYVSRGDCIAGNASVLARL